MKVSFRLPLNIVCLLWRSTGNWTNIHVTVLVSCRVLICVASFCAVPVVVVCYFARPASAHVLPSSNSSEIVMHVAVLSCSRVLICASILMSITIRLFVIGSCLKNEIDIHVRSPSFISRWTGNKLQNNVLNSFEKGLKLLNYANFVKSANRGSLVVG